MVHLTLYTDLGDPWGFFVFQMHRIKKRGFEAPTKKKKEKKDRTNGEPTGGKGEIVGEFKIKALFT